MARPAGVGFFQGSTYRQVAQRFGCSQCTIARWVERCRRQGLEGRQSRPRQSSGTGRRQQLLAVFLPETVPLRPRALKRLGYSWQRAKRTLTSPDPDYRAKKGQ